MNRTLLIIFSLALFGAALLASPRTTAAQDFRVEGAGLEATPISYSGPCPGLITFKGKIQASAAGRVKYTYSYSDGGSGPAGYVDFDGPGVKLVETTWRLGDSSILPRYEGWAMLKVTYPNAYESNKAKFVLECKQGGRPQPQPQPQPKPGTSGGEENQAAEIEPPRLTEKRVAKESRRQRFNGGHSND